MMKRKSETRAELWPWVNRSEWGALFFCSQAFNLRNFVRFAMRESTPDRPLVDCE